MKVGIDIRPLVEETLTGIGQATQALLSEIIKDNSIEWYLYYNHGKKQTEPDIVKKLAMYPNVHIVATRYPNKIFNLALASGIITLDSVIRRKAHIPFLDWIFLPNLGFATVSKHTRMMLAVHDLSFKRFPDFFSGKRLWWHRILRPKKLITRANIIIVPSKNTRKDLRKIYQTDLSKVHVVPHGRVELNSVREKKSDSSIQIPDNFFLALSTIEPRKNFEGLVRAYKESGLFSRGIELVIVGARGWRDRAVLKSFKHTPGIRYLGFVSPEDKKVLLSHARALVYPSFYEGFGLPVLEAFCYGIPVITSDRSSLPDLCDGAAYLVRPHMVSDMVNALRDIACNEKLREWYSKKGRERAEFFSWEKAGNRVLELLHRSV